MTLTRVQVQKISDGGVADLLVAKRFMF